MAFTQKKFLALKPANQLKKTLFVLEQFIKTGQNQEYLLNLLSWINQTGHYHFAVPLNLRDCQLLDSRLRQLLNIEDPYCEEKLFDNFNEKITRLPYQVVLDNIRSPFNVGAIFRSAECFLAEKLILCGITPTPEQNSKVHKTAKQAIIPYQYEKNSLETVSLLKQTHRLYAIEKTPCSKPLQQTVFQLPCVLILGNEEFGVDQDILNVADEICHIPLLGGKNSLNVSSAASIVFYAIAAQFS